MAEPESATNDPRHPDHVPVKVGHPRWNVVMVLVIIGVILAFALIEAQRLALGQ